TRRIHEVLALAIAGVEPVEQVGVATVDVLFCRIGIRAPARTTVDTRADLPAPDDVVTSDAPLGEDLDHPVRGLRAVQRRRRSTLHDLDARDVLGRDVLQ